VRLLMLCDFPSELLAHSPDELWSERFLPTPVLNLLEGFSSMPDIEPWVLSFSRERAVSGCLWGRVRVRVVRVPKGTGLSTGYFLRIPIVRAVVRRLEPDIVHGQGVEAGYAWLAVNQPRPAIITLHGVLGFTAQLRTGGVYPRLARAIQWVTMKRATDVIAISEAVARWIRGHSKARAHLLPNPVHPSFYSLPPTSEPEFDFLYVGRICPEKGLMDAIEALRELDRRGLPVKLGVVGRESGHGGYLRRCAQVASALQRSSVTFLGPQPTLLPLRRARALILPSYGESFSMAAAEASAAGRPVVAYKTGGVPSVVIHERTGLLVEPGDIRALADAMGTLVLNSALAHSLGREARKRAAAWHRDRVCQLTIELYRELIFRRSRESQRAPVTDAYSRVL